jgi:hypothetical protein
MWLGIIFGILAEFLGIEMYFKGKESADDSDQERKSKNVSRRLGIKIFAIGTLLLIFCFVISIT